MDVYAIRQQLKTKSIYEIPLRVTFYARVSSESDAQLNSLDNQVSYYVELIKKNKNWTFVNGYIDEGLTGATTKNRENFHNMIADGKAGLFDLVITKEISRFARNTLDSIMHTRELLASGVGVFFQNDNINTLEEDSELRLTIMSGIAQDELRKLSSRVKFGHQQAIKNSVVLGSHRMIGYTQQNRRLYINEGEAPMVRELFELYATGNYSFNQLSQIFWDKGYRNMNGNKITHSTLSGMIANPKYKGYYVGNKVKVVDIFTKKQKFLPADEWVMFKDESGEIIPAIVGEELWERANDVLSRRSKDVKTRQGICNHPNLMTGKMVCTHCGKKYYRRDSKDRSGNKNSIWYCSGKINNGAASCPSTGIYETEIKKILYEVFTDTKDEVEALLEQYITFYMEAIQGEDVSKQIDGHRSRIDLLNKKKSKLLEYNVTGKISDDDFLMMSRECSSEIAAAERAIFDLEQQQLSQGELKQHIDDMRAVINCARDEIAGGAITKEFVEKYIDTIYVSPEDGKLSLEIKLFTGKKVSKLIENIRFRMGVTGKKMIQQYQQEHANQQ